MMWLRNVLVYICFAWLVVGGTTDLAANNISVSNVRLTGKNTTSNYVMVEFDLSWENSWRTTDAPNNWDAAWVFIKFRVARDYISDATTSSTGTTVTVGSTTGLRVGMPIYKISGTGAVHATLPSVVSQVNTGTTFTLSATPATAFASARIGARRIWEHAYLHNADHVAGDGTGTGATVQLGLVDPAAAYNATTNPGVGAFFYRSGNGSGTTTINNAQLRWNYGDNNVGDDDPIEVQVCAIEMVYVPQGEFNVGGGGGGFTSTTINTSVANTTPSGTGSLGGQAGGHATGATAPNADWPNGYNAFYCMKYEISQGQYRDFLNTLTYRQQGTRTVNVPSSAAGTAALSNANRNGIDIMTPGNATTLQPAAYACNLDGDANYNESVDGEWIACGFISWMDGSAYLDWAGLRPMTELEFEKTCRGNEAAVANEYAWGTATRTNAGTGSIVNSGAINETSNTANANVCYGNVTGGPLRVGVFAGAATTRVQAGATYYGVMEMSGNLYERVVSNWYAEGRAFTGIHGDGLLSSAGNATTTLWPGLNTGEVTDANGSGFKGGMWNSTTESQIRVSDRQSIASQLTGRFAEYGFRGVRTAP